jgi:uncharacterized membrane protein
MGFTLVMLLALITLVTNYDKFIAFGAVGSPLFYASLAVIVMQGVLGFGRTTFWSYVANAIVSKPPKIGDDEDVLSGMVNFYVDSVMFVDEAKTRQRFVAQIGAAAVGRIVVYTVLGGCVGLVVGLLV